MYYVVGLNIQQMKYELRKIYNTTTRHVANVDVPVHRSIQCTQQ